MKVDTYFLGIFTGIIGGIIAGWILIVSQSMVKNNNLISLIIISTIVTILMLLFIKMIWQNKLKNKIVLRKR